MINILNYSRVITYLKVVYSGKYSGISNIVYITKHDIRNEPRHEKTNDLHMRK